MRVQAAATARDKLTIYATAIAHIQQRLGPVFLVVRDAAGTDPECAALWSGIAERRAANMRNLAGDLRATGEIREDLTDQQVADVIWSMNAAEYWDLLVRQRGWESDAFAALAGRRLDTAPATRSLNDSTRGRPAAVAHAGIPPGGPDRTPAWLAETGPAGGTCDDGRPD